MRSSVIALLVLLSACSSPETPAPDVRWAALQGDASDPFTLAANTPTTKTMSIATQSAHYYKLTVPANHAGMRVAVKSNVPVNVLLHEGTAASGASDAVYTTTLGTLFRTQELTGTSAWYVSVEASANVTYTITFESQYARALTWDAGTTLNGSQTVSTPSNGFGDYLYAITARASTYGAWRTVLKNTVGDADLLMQQGGYPYDGTQWSAIEDGPNGLLLGPNEFGDNQSWLIRVRPRAATSTWSLFSGDVYVQDLGALAVTSSSTSVTPDVFGLAFFKTQVAGDVLAWRLATPNAGIYVARTAVPIPRRSDTFELTAQNETLVVPPVLTSGQYLVAIETTSARVIDSRRQVVTDAPGDKFHFAVNGNDANGYGYVTYKLEVPDDEVGWRVALDPGAIGNDVDLYVKRGAVPAEYENGGLSEAYGAVDTITQVPPSLSNGTWYVTVKGQAPFSFTLTSGEPERTTIDFVDTVTNSGQFVNDVGWRYFVVEDIASQVGTLGWILDLSGHVPGSEIAIRRNALPGRWSQRTRNGSTSYDSEVNHMDATSLTGFLEQPNHEADIWYVGIYMPNSPLGDFTLKTDTFKPTDLSFNGGSQVVGSQTPGRWRYFKVTVPPDALAWDLRLDNVTGAPRMVLRTELLPPDFNTVPGYPTPLFLYDTWGSGQQWAPGNPFTARPVRDVAGDLVDETGRHFFAGMGGPLRQGVVYVGVNEPAALTGAGTGTPLSYTIVSRGVGLGATWSIPVSTLTYAGGSATVTNVASRELRVYKIDVPANSASLAVEVHPTAGDAMMAVGQGHVPNSEAGYYYNESGQPNGTRRQKAGDDFFYRYPKYGESDKIPAGPYYVVVGAEGVVTQDGVIGNGTSSWAITSRGAQTVKGSATTAVDDSHPLSFVNETLRFGEQRAYRFTVPAGVSSIEVRLTRKAGQPAFAVMDDQGAFPSPQQSYYAAEGGIGSIATDDTIVTLQAPSGVYTVVVTAMTDTQGQDVAATYDLGVVAQGEQVLDFNDGEIAIDDQESQTWRYFEVVVPQGALGWDLRLENVTGGTPRMVIRRDQLPETFQTTYFGPYNSLFDFDHWESTWVWAPSADLTGRPYSPYVENGPTGDEFGRRVSMGMGSPLEPGTYYVGVSDVWSQQSGDAMRYSIVSRGIGIGAPWTIQVRDLDWANGTHSATLEPREIAYYRVSVPAGRTSWEADLTMAAGDAALALRQGSLPNAGATSGYSYDWTYTYAGTRRDKDGGEYFDRYLDASEDAIGSGYAYIAVAAQGAGGVLGAYIGTGATSYTLRSRGLVDVVDAPGPLGATPIRFDDQNLAYGAQRTYRVQVPTGTVSFEARLEDKTGGPYLTVGPATGRFPSPYTSGYTAHQGGESYLGANGSIVTVAEPDGTYLVTVTANPRPNDGVAVDSKYDLVIQAVDDANLAFNGGSVNVSDQESQTWRYFRVHVPAGALGWDLRLEDVTSGQPQMVIRRDDLPETFTTTYFGPYNSIYDLDRWETGWQWAPAADLTGRPYGVYDPIGNTTPYENGRRISMGMGSPLEPGDYVIGVSDIYAGPGEPMSYRVASRGIGQGNDGSGNPWLVQGRDLAFGQSVTTDDIQPRELVYYRVQVPEGLESFGAHLAVTKGEAMMAVRNGALPNAAAPSYYYYPIERGAGQRRQKPGDEFFYKLPDYDQSRVAGGIVYIAVAAEGDDPYSTSYIGTGPSSWTLDTFGPVPINGGSDRIVQPGSPDVVFANQTQPYGALKVFRVRVPRTVQAVEVRLRNKVGGPYFAAAVHPFFDAHAVAPYQPNYQSVDGGASTQWQGDVADQVIGVSGELTIAVSSTNGQTVTDAGYDLVIKALSVTELPWDGGHANVNLEDQGAALYHVTVPQDCDGVAQAGWIVTQGTSAGTMTVQVRQDVLPEAQGATQVLQAQSKQTIVVPPYLQPGNWYVMVTANGTTLGTIDTQEVKEARHWTMPKRDENANVPGLSHPLFGDSGIQDDGSPLPGPTDRGVDLAEGTFRFYRVTVPKDNAGLMRTRIEAISGDPDLYIRKGAAPTLNQIPGYPYGYQWDYSDTLDGSSYGHWVAPDTKYGVELAPGEYWLGVYAQGSNVRYRLKVDVGRVNDLALTNGTASDALAAGDMRYYRVQIPQTNATQGASTPIDWKITFTQQDGDAAIFFREGVPPGLYSTVPDPQPNQSYDYLLRDWNGDRGTSTLPYIENTGTTTLSLPMVRPNTTYWLGVYARTDTTFDVASAVNATRQKIDGVLAYDSGVVDVTLPIGASRLYRIDVPADAARWLHHATVPDGVNLYLSQGLVATVDHADWQNGGYSWNSDLDRALLAPDGMVGNFPFVAGESYYLLVVNDSGASAPVHYELDGRDVLDDDDDDTLPDGWEYDNFGGVYYDPSGDPDYDGLDNGEELDLGTSPRDGDSDDDLLSDAAELFAGGDPLVADTDHDLVCDGSDSAPDDPSESGPVIRLEMHLYEGGQYGNGYGTNQHRTRLAAIFDRYSVKQHWLHITGWDIEGATEVQVFLNGHSLGYLPVGGNNQESMPVLWWVDDALLVSAPLENRVELRAAGGDTTWGVKDMGLFTYGDTFGQDSTQAYDTKHVRGLDVRWQGPQPDSLVELRAFDLEQADDVTLSLDNDKLFDPFPATGNLQWGRYWQFPLIAADRPDVGERVLKVRPRVGSDGDYQLRIVEQRPIPSPFGDYGVGTEDSHALESVNVLMGEKTELRELIVELWSSPGASIDRTGTLGDGAWDALPEGQESKPIFYFSDVGDTDTLMFDRVDPLDAENPYFNVRILYFGPCKDTDFDQVLDCADAFPNDYDEWDDLDHDGLGDNWETKYFGGLDVANATTNIDGDDKRDDQEFLDRDDPVCADLDQDSYLGATQYCVTGNDCDDHDAGVGPGANDNDCDGVPTAEDCDDSNSSIGASAGDHDCDGVPTAADCDDDNATIGARAADLDCDGVPNALDCAPTNPAITATNVGDMDCDGLGDAIDCGPNDPSNTRSNVGDANCDGIPDDVCVGDADCDGVGDAIDCDPNDAQNRRSRVNDRDCDGVPDPLDCAPDDGADLRSNVGDSDCDGVGNGLDCAPENPAVTTTNVGDLDCDGVADALDCGPSDPSDIRPCNCDDADDDGHYAIGEGCPIGEDCDDDDDDSTIITEDADCDGSITDDDCDDEDPEVKGPCPVACQDLDGDGADGRTPECPAGNDCDDDNAKSTTYDVDAECDGAPDADDVCPDVADNQLDTDDDGVGDACDNCVAIANQDQADVNANDLGDVCEDFDRDGVVDGDDNCPQVANADQLDTDADQIGDVCDPSDDGTTTTSSEDSSCAGAGGAWSLLAVLMVMMRRRTRVR